MTNTTVAYPAFFAATGGPGWSPEIIEHSHSVEYGPMSLIVLGADEVQRFAIVNSEGQVYARSDSAADLADWLNDYAEALDAMNADGEL